MSLEGELRLEVGWDGRQVTAVRTLSTRPQIAGIALRDLPSAEAVVLAGRLFALCGRAQSTAAACATEASEGVTETEASAHARDRVIAAEMAHEHFWHFLMEQPRQAGLAPRVTAMGRARVALQPILDGAAQAGAGAASGVAAEEIYARAPGDWLALGDWEAFAAWTREAATPVAARLGEILADDGALGASPVALMPPVDANALRSGLAGPMARDKGFALAPHWDGEPRETGAAARRSGHRLVAEALRRFGRGVAARFVARLVELAEVLAELERATASRRHGAIAADDGDGIAWVETARGLLLHRARIEEGRVADYAIVAPTEWNFHPRGAFAAGAKAIAARDEAELARRVRLVAASLDPCVAWRAEVAHA